MHQCLRELYRGGSGGRGSIGGWRDGRSFDSQRLLCFSIALHVKCCKCFLRPRNGQLKHIHFQARIGLNGAVRWGFLDVEFLEGAGAGWRSSWRNTTFETTAVENWIRIAHGELIRTTVAVFSVDSFLRVYST